MTVHEFGAHGTDMQLPARGAASAGHDWQEQTEKSTSVRYRFDSWSSGTQVCGSYKGEVVTVLGAAGVVGGEAILSPPRGRRALGAAGLVLPCCTRGYKVPGISWAGSGNGTTLLYQRSSTPP
eukprot:1337745-Rhodomonas_salina.1